MYWALDMNGDWNFAKKKGYLIKTSFSLIFFGGSDGDLQLVKFGLEEVCFSL